MNVAETQNIFITPSELIEYLYCPRFIYFMNCLNIPQHEEQRYKVMKGRQVHEEKKRLNPDYVRKRLSCVSRDIDVYMSSERLHIKGKVDEVLHIDDGTLAPMDYKYAQYREVSTLGGKRIYKTHKFQSVLYAMLIRETYNKEVKKGYVCYVRSKNKIEEIVYTLNDFEKARGMIEEMLSIIQSGYFPRKTSSRIRCIDCCYRNICV